MDEDAPLAKGLLVVSINKSLILASEVISGWWAMRVPLNTAVGVATDTRNSREGAIP